MIMESSPYPPNPEEMTPLEKLKSAVNDHHESFLKLVPNFDRNIWLPYEALSSRGGSCAAEAFFVAHKLLESKAVAIEDLSLGVFRDHGELVRAGFIGSEKPISGHAILFVTLDNQTYEFNFRMNRADDDPGIESVSKDSLSEDRLKWVEPINEALSRYGTELLDNRGCGLTIQACTTDPQSKYATPLIIDPDF